MLKDQGIFPKVHPLSPTALIVTEGARRVQQSEAYLSGLVEIQDVASQAVVDALCLRPGARVLDYCAGGGGKALAMAAQVNGAVFVHDANPGRMSDLGARAERAGADLRVLKNHAEAKSKGPFDLVLADVPCSGSGAWRRQPDAKWALTPAMLNDLLATQRDILTKASALVAPHGLLAYATCSLLDLENAGQIDRFVSENPQWQVLSQRNFTPLDGGDGLFVAQLTRVEA